MIMKDKRLVDSKMTSHMQIVMVGQMSRGAAGKHAWSSTNLLRSTYSLTSRFFPPCVRVGGAEALSKQPGYATLASLITTWVLGQPKKEETRPTQSMTSARTLRLYVQVKKIRN